MKRPLLGLAVAALAIGAAWADDHAAPSADPAAARQALMANVGKSTGLLAAMAREEAPFDARVAEAALRTINAAAIGFGTLFPEGSETGAETEAAPAIWTDRAGFEAAIAALYADSAAALAAEPADLASFTPLFGAVAGNCRSCHEGYRINTD